MLPTAPEGTPTLTLESGLTVRPWAEGDDLKLLELWGDPENPMHHQDRSLLRPSSNDPWSRCIVAEDEGVPVAAATIFRSSLHPDRLSFYIEVAPEQRRKGVAAQLLQILEAEVPNCEVQSLKARCAKGSAAQCFLKDNGFRKIQHSRKVIIQPGSLAVPDVENLPIDLEDIATGSVELTQLVADFYNAVHEWDRSEMTIGRAQQMLLAPEAGATGAVVLRDTSSEDESNRPITAFAVSYTPQRTEDPADVLLGWDPELREDQAEYAVRQLLGLVAARYPVSVEVDDAMVPLKTVTDELAARDEAEVDFEALIYARDA
ncbi:GNAT family N-acetyltransferase [Nesterenkonia sp. MY13]|uniref:GNAT family N-acetyltransferase n=1 Tax=Nesterenkonia sedimenti TaxID=1463632 RepID=A0A7X8TIS7_9MICC|nr:GNAT family N-acetyltransferase [Nesterenkonia sedimenti]NLS09528.1 GNAT family N-acetyltransferase [Nesterenkonia sedimenti]